MPQLNTLIAAMRAALSRTDSDMALDPRDRAQNQMAHGRLALGASAMTAPVLALFGTAHPVLWSLLVPLSIWAVAETVQTARVSWSAAHGWDTAADLGGWLGGWAVLAMLAAAGAEAGAWMAAAGVVSLVSPVAIGVGYWLKYGSRNPA